MEPCEKDPPRLEGGAAMTGATGAEANAGTSAVRPGFALDEDALGRWMRAHVPGFDGPMQIRQFRGGQSNPTYLLRTPGADYVLRRRPAGPLAPGAHAVDREARVQTALRDAGFPVARIHGLCTDEAVLGSWFYVMDRVDGRIFWQADLPEIAAADRPAYYAEMNRTLARLHHIDPAQIGLGDYGRHGNYIERQIARWTASYLADPRAGRDPGMDRLIDWLPTAIPAGDETAIIHGDYRCDNLIFHPTEPRILAVLDWELSTLGHPLADFVYHALLYRMPPDIVAGLGGADPRALNLPTEAEYIAAYCAASGRAGLPDYEFYVAFNLFRLAAIFHGIKGRALRGTAASPHALERAASFPKLVRLALDAIESSR